MSAGLIEAGVWLLGLDGEGHAQLRFDAALRIDGGMVAQIGCWEAVSYGVEHLPRLGLRGGLALPLFVSSAPPTLADRFGGESGRLTPGSPAHLAVFAPGIVPSREALLRGEPGAVGFVAGKQLATLRGFLVDAPSEAEAKLWSAAARLAHGG